jgi:predicted phosphodiesterase
VAIFSDVHGNLPALEAFLAATRDVVDTYVCLGDVVDYGPWNDECLERIEELPGIVLLEGNHERLFLGADPVEDERPLVQDFYRHSIQFFSRRDLISGLPESVAVGEFVGSHTIDGRRIYADTEVAIHHSYFIGHTHHQYEVRRSGWRIVNCGSVGQNRKRVDRAAYAIYDTGSGDVELREEPYDAARLMRELSARRYPPQCLEYYRGKLGDERPS